MKKALTLTVVAHMTSNYGEGLGNIASVQKIFKDGKTYSMRSRESLKYALMTESGMYKDLKATSTGDGGSKSGVTQKLVDQENNVSNTKALEGGYMNTAVKVGKDTLTKVRNSSFYLTDAISVSPLNVDGRFHNNLGLAKNFAEANGKNVQNNAGEVGLMPYQYEYDKGLKVYSFTIDLTKVGVDENFKDENGDPLKASDKEKAERVEQLLEGIANLSLVVKGNLDNAEPLFIVGGLSNRMTHYFENVVRIKENKLQITEDFAERVNSGYKVGLLNGENLDNEQEIQEKLNPISMLKFFNELKKDVKANYGV